VDCYFDNDAGLTSFEHVNETETWWFYLSYSLDCVQALQWTFDSGMIPQG
jgi:hypothetical protein